MPAPSLSSTAGVSADRPNLVGQQAPRRSAGATWGIIIATIGVLAALAGYGMVGLVAAILALAVALAKGRTALSGVPAATVLVMTCVVVLVQLAAIADWPNFGGAVVSRLTVAGLCVAAGLLVYRRRAALASWQPTDLPEAVALLPALLLAGLGVWMATMPVARATNWFFIGADNVAHALNVAEVGAMGRLDYSVWGKPGGWLSFVSVAVASEGDARGTQGGVLALVSTNAAMLWALYVLVCATASLLAMAVVHQFGGHRWAASIAGLAAGAVMLWPQFFVFTMGAGFQTTIVQAFLLAAAAFEVLHWRAGELRAFVICSAALVLTAHNYPLLLPTAGMLWLGSLGLLRRGRGWQVDRRDRAVITLSVCSALATAPVLQTLFVDSAYGVQIAQSPVGFTMRLPVEWVFAGICAGALCLAMYLRSRAAGWVGLAVVVAFMEPMAAWLLLDVPLQNYYPTKLLWHVAALGVPLVTALCTLGFLILLQRCGRRAMKRALAAPGLVILTILVLAAGASVLPAPLGKMSKDGGRILRASISTYAPDAQVVWRAGQIDEEDWSMQRLIAAYHAGQGLTVAQRTPRGLSQQCETLRLVRSPAVLTRRSQAEVTAHFSCALGVVAVTVQDSPIK